MIIINIIKNKKTKAIDIIRKNRFLSFAIWVMIITCLVLGQQGCAFTHSKTVSYQVQNPMMSYTYTWSCENVEDEPLSLKEWLDIIGYGVEDEASEVEEKEL